MSQLVAKKCKYFSIFVLGKTSLKREGENFAYIDIDYVSSI